MILPDFVLPGRTSQHWYFSGIDSFEHCLDKQHFKSYPYDIDYVYNSRGFRDQEWPDTLEQLKNAIWCFGDSFTLGIGSPKEHTWPHILQQKSNQRVINISLDGASNEWIARKVTAVLKIISPATVIIHWSYIERRDGFKSSVELNRKWIYHYNKIKGPDWPDCIDLENYDTLPGWILKELEQHDQSWREGIPDETLRLSHVKSGWREDIKNTLDCINQVNALKANTKMIHSFIPAAIPDNYQKSFNEQLDKSDTYIPFFTNLDYARDGLHYDRLTADWLVDHMIQELGSNICSPAPQIGQ